MGIPGTLFAISSEDLKKIIDWKSQLDKKILEEQRKTMSKEDFEHLTCGGKYPYSGTIGGDLTYMFTPTSLGTIVKVQDQKGNILDLTLYEDF